MKSNSRYSDKNVQRQRRIEEEIREVEALLEEREYDEAQETIEYLVNQYPRETSVFQLAVETYHQIKQPWKALYYLRKLADLDSNYLVELVEAYQNLEMETLSLQAARRWARLQRDPEKIEMGKQLVASAENHLRFALSSLGSLSSTVEEGLRLMEEAQVALHNNDMTRCIQLNLQSIKILPNFPPPQNNLSLAYFYSGQWAHAIQIARNVIGYDPKNIQARANLIHFLAWTGGREEAALIWTGLRNTRPPQKDLLIKILETAAIMDDDEVVFNLLRAKDSRLRDLPDADPVFAYYLAVAEANLGKRGAQTILSRLAEEGYPGAEETREAIRLEKRGRGLSGRFHYKQSIEVFPQQFRNFFKSEEYDPEDFEATTKQIRQKVGRYPQMVVGAKKLIYEEDQAHFGCRLLAMIGTPEAFSVLKEFGTGQAGSKEDRMRALNLLLENNQIPNGTRMTIWDQDHWTEIDLRRILVSDEDDRPYSTKVKKMLDEGLRLHHKGKREESKKKYLEVLQIEPQAKEAWNNLATFYILEDQEEKGVECLLKAIEIDPHYAMPRCNLANHYLSQNLIEKAEEMILPLNSIEKISSLGMANLSFVRARIAYAKKDYDQAETNLEIALQFDPDMEAALKLKDSVQMLKMLDPLSPNSWFARDKERRKRARQKQGAQIVSPAPHIQEVLELYSRDVLQAVARVWCPYGGWSTYKKQELIEFLREGMQTQEWVETMLGGLENQDIEAWKWVKEQGGMVDWQEFAAKYDQDGEESPYWQYHQPTTIMGRLRLRCLLAEATIDGKLVLVIPREIQPAVPV